MDTNTGFESSGGFGKGHQIHGQLLNPIRVDVSGHENRSSAIFVVRDERPRFDAETSIAHPLQGLLTHSGVAHGHNRFQSGHSLTDCSYCFHRLAEVRASPACRSVDGAFTTKMAYI